MNVHYDSESGLLFNKYNKKIGSLRQDGRINVQINGINYKAHRLAWFLTHGIWPENEIDHINGDPSDNRLCNLREANHSQNMTNRKTQKNNTTGIPGISWDKSRRKWSSYLQIGGKKKTLGRFDNLFDAICVRKSAENSYFGEFIRR